MPVISDAEIAALAKAQGLSDSQAAIAVAVALAESGGNTTAHNAIPPDDSYGLWQINMFGSLGPSRRKQFGIVSNSDLYSPQVNAKAMRIISSGGSNWKPWTTYTTGRYLTFMSRANKAVGNPATTIPVGNPLNPIDALDTAKKIIGTLSDATWWRRATLFLFGLGLMWLAFFRLTGDNKLSPVVKEAVKLVAVKKL